MPARQELDVITPGNYRNGQQIQGRVIALDDDQTAAVVQVYRTGFDTVPASPAIEVFIQQVGDPKQYHLMTIDGGEHTHRLGFVTPFSTARVFLKSGVNRQFRLICRFLQDCPCRVDLNLLTLSRSGIKAIERGRDIS